MKITTFPHYIDRFLIDAKRFYFGVRYAIFFYFFFLCF